MQADPPTEPPAPTEMHPLAAAFVQAHEQLAPKLADAHFKNVENLLETFEADIGPLVAPIAQELLNDPTTHDALRPFLGALAGPTHFGESVLIGIAIGSILSPVLGAAFAPIVQGVANTAWPKLANAPLSPELLAAAVLKGVLQEAEAANQAITTGYNSTSFHTMVEVAGQSIGTAEALLLYRRGQISAAQLQEVLQYSNINPKFYSFVPMLEYVPLNVGEVVSANLKGHLDDATAATYLGHAGIDPTFQPLLKLAAGRPIGPETAAALNRYGKITDAQFTEIIRQSDVNDAFEYAVRLTADYLVPPRSIVAMLRANALTPAQATDLLNKNGVDPEIQAAFVAEATHTKASAGKDLTQAQVNRLYGAQIITRAEATTRLTALGLPAADITLLLDYEDNLRPEKLMNALISKIGNLYVGHKLTKTEAVTHLGNGNVPAATQHDLFAVWDIERTAQIHNLTPASIVGAFRRGYITAADCKTRLTAVGVAPTDLGIVVADGYPPTKGAEAIAAARAVIAA